jgi:3-oxoadipate enol-lactonase
MEPIRMMSNTPPQPDRTFSVTTADGCNLTVRAYRERAGRAAVLLVHALAMDGSMWNRVIEALSPELAVYTVDCRGHGLSDHPPGPYSIRLFADDLASVAGALDAGPVHLVGCSMGGTASLACAGAHPQLLASLTVIDASAWYGEQAPAAWEKRASQALSEGLASLIPFQVERWFSADFAKREAAQAEAAKAIFLRNDLAAYAASCRMLGIADTRANLGAFKGPSAVVVGEEDYATPVAMAREIVDLLADAELTVIPGVRHYTPIEVPRAIAACIEDCVSRGRKS